MAGLVPASHVFLASGSEKQDVDARHKAGHDEDGVHAVSTGSPDFAARLGKIFFAL
jgi:hypothetical protein